MDGNRYVGAGDLPAGIMTGTDSAPTGTIGVLLGVLGLLAIANVARSVTVPSAWHLAFGLGLATAVVAIGSLARLSAEELGLETRTLPQGLALGGLVFLAITAVVTVAALVPAAAGLFDDDRADIGFSSLLVRVLVIIPIGTVLVEELIFRGVLHGLLSRLVSPLAALIIGAVIFGLWHVFPAWRATSEEATVAGTFLLTSVAGLGFGWLRVRSGSVAAPALAHLGTNTIALTAAWILAR